MFTGIITHHGCVVEITPTTLSLSTSPDLLKKLKKGSSIAVNGVCFTVTKTQSDTFSVDVIPETLERTALRSLHREDIVNLELPMTADGRLEGHIVQGHVDGVAQIATIAKEKNSCIISFKSDKSLTNYMVPKGSIAIDGISLTLISVADDRFSVGIIPYTLQNTNMKSAKVGKKVNIETDIIGKYVMKFENGGIYAKKK